MITKERRWQQVIVLLFLFLLGWPVLGWADGDGTKENPFRGDIGEQTLLTGTHYLNGVSPGMFGNTSNIIVKGDVTLIITGENSLEGGSENGGWSYPAIRVNKDDRLTIKGTGFIELEGYGDSPAIGAANINDPLMWNCGTIILEGSVSVYAAGKNGVSIGKVARYSELISSGTLTLRDGATLYCTDGMTDRAAAKMTIGNFAAVGFNQSPNQLGIANEHRIVYGTCYIETNTVLTLNGDKRDYPMYSKMGINHELLLYFNGTAPDYIELTDRDKIKIPVSPKKGKTVLLGAAVKSDAITEVNYPLLNATFTNDITLNVTNYPHSGTLKAGASMIFSGGSEGHILKTASGGLTLDATSNSLCLAGISCPAGVGNKLIIKGKVYKKEASLIGNGVTVDDKGTAVYYCTTTIPVGTVSKVTCNSLPITNYYQDKTSFCMWLPAGGNNKVEIETDKGIVYTYTGNIPATQDQTLTVYATRFNINNSSLTLTTATSGNQSIIYSGQTYLSPFATPITILGNTTSGNNVTLQGGATGNVTFEGVSITGNTVPLTVTGNTMMNLTVTGTNSFTSTGGTGIQINSGSTLNMTGSTPAVLAVSATNASYKDINNLGTMKLSGSFTLKAVNSKFPPSAAITGSPKVELGGVAYYRTWMNTTSYTSVKELLGADGNAFNTNLYYDGSMSEKKFWFWMPAVSPKITFKATKSGVESVYMLPSQSVSAHNTELTPLPLVAAIGDTYYETLAAAFAAATKDKVIVLKADYVLPNNTMATLSQLTRGEKATLDLGTFKLTGATNTTLSGGLKRGTLRIISSNGGLLAGSFILDGCVYTELNLNNVSFQRGAQAVYRVKTTGFPGGIGQQVTYGSSPMGPTEYDAWRDDVWGACLWLPAGSQTLRLASVRDIENEPVATAALTVASDHTNALTSLSPLADVGYGNVNITAEADGAATLRCGRQPYVWPLSGLSASKRLTVSGHSTASKITVGGTATAWLTLDQVNIEPVVDQAALVVEGGAQADFELSGKSYLYGGYGGSTVQPAVSVGNAASLVLRSAEGTGSLYAKGLELAAISSAAIQVATDGLLSVEGGTLTARHGDARRQAEAVKVADRGRVRVKAGSVDALFSVRPTNKVTNEKVYKVTITTGLEPGQPYDCTYRHSGTSDGTTTDQTFRITPDADGKVYFWLPAQLVSDDKTKVILTHPTSFEKKEIEIVMVDENDLNVAPIMVEMRREGVADSQKFGNLKDAFDALQAGTSGNPSRYTLRLLTNIGTLRTRQVVPANTEVSLDLGNFEIGALNGSDVAFDASAAGSYLQITGKGNIKNTFRIAGDVFITGVVPLTDATIEYNGKAVFRTLVKDLPVAAGNSYTYSYGQQQNISFILHDGIACLWLPDYGRNEELRFGVSSSGSTTEYTAGSITTVTQRTEAIPANPVGVVVRVVYDKVNQAYNTLQEAFNAIKKAPAGSGDITATLLSGVSLSGQLSAGGNFTLNLDGKNITAASGSKLTLADRARVVITDQTPGVKGNLQADIELMGDARLFVPGSIRLQGNVTKGATNLWRTMVNMNYQDASVTQITYATDPTPYPVIGREACVWLAASQDMTKVYSFGVGGTTVTVTGRVISSNHLNDMTLGGNDDEARIGTSSHATLTQAFAAATGDKPIEMLKTIQLSSPITLTPPGGGKKALTLELGKYGVDSALVVTQISPITIPTDTRLTVTSSSGTGRLHTPLTLTGSGLLYIGQSVTGDNIGAVTVDGQRRYRLLMTNLPASIPTGDYAYIYADPAGVGTAVTGHFRAENGVACLWLPEKTAWTLSLTVAGSAFETKNVTANPNHYNIETYGVSDVAQIRNGKKYLDLNAAFLEGAGKTIVLLKNAPLKADVVIVGSVTLDMAGYSITAQTVSGGNASFTIPESGNLSVIGKGSITAGFDIMEVTRDIQSNGNLQVEAGVSMTGQVKLGRTESGQLVYEERQRVSLSGLPVAKPVAYTYGAQEGTAFTASDGTLCLWMKTNVQNLYNFYVDVLENGVRTKTYQAAQVTITGTHSNPLVLSAVSAVAEIGGISYDTLKEAFEAATSNSTITLRKDVTNLSGSLLPGNGATAVTLDLSNNQLSGSNLGLDAGAGQLVVKNGTLTGTLTLAGNVYVAPDATMTGAYVSLEGKTVWRTFLTLPDGTLTFSYRMGSETTTPLTTSTNIYRVEGRSMACLWLPSSNMAQPLTVKAGNQEYVLNNIIIASTHGNELNVLTNNRPVAETGGVQYASLASALAAAIENGTVTLKDNLSLASVQEVTKSLILDLADFSFTSGGSGFTVAADKTLTLKRGMLLGSVRLKGEGTVRAGADVTIAGLVLDKENKEVCRTLIKPGPAAAATECRWIRPVTMEYDLTLTQDVDTYEATVPVTLSGHNTVLTAYKRQELAGNVTWQVDYANTNLVLGIDAVLDISSAAGATIHRLSLYDGARVTGTGQVTASEGIRYIRTFKIGNIWESIALPFTASRLTAALPDVENPLMLVTTLLVPATGNGTSGHFWLKTMDATGRLQSVSSTEMTANVSYLMAVPPTLTNKAITFVSGPNQLLRRNRVLAVKPAAGFASYANGTLDEQKIEEPCYILADDGATYERQQTHLLLPFRGYLLADVSTTTVTPRLRVGVPTLVAPVISGSLKVYGGRHCLTVETDQPVTVSVHHMSGYLIGLFKLTEGRHTLSLPAGIYIVNRTKVVVK